MKRLAINCAALLIIVALGFVANRSYAPLEKPIRATTSQDRVQEIAQRVDAKYDYVSVPFGSIQKLENDVAIIRYVVLFTAPANLFSQGSLRGAQALELRKAIVAFQHALVDLLRLSREFVMKNDPFVQAVIIEVHFPDGSVQRAVAVVEQLRPLSPDAPAEEWFSKLTFYQMQVTPLQVQESPSDSSGT